MLAASFLCNVVVLFTPFMNLRTGLKTEPYSLFRSVHMFWVGGLWVLAILVVGFSIIFPFAKLAVLTALTFTDHPTTDQLRWLHLVERFAKWSMLDVFLVCLILSLTSGQIFVGAAPMIGIPLFIVAILLSMSVGEILTVQFRAPHTPSATPPIPPHGFWLVLSGLALGATLVVPFLGIHDWRLVDHTFSIAGLVPVLWTNDAMPAALLAAAFLVATPLAAWVMSFVSWWQLRSGIDNQKVNYWATAFRRWSMLEVFGLALGVFAIEGGNLMKTEMRWGALLLAGTLLLQRMFDSALVRRRISRG